MTSSEPCAHCGASHPGTAVFCPFTGKALGGLRVDRLIGASVGDYTLSERIGAGATAIVYSATSSDGENVAIKILKVEQATDQSRALARFEREVRATITLRHPHIVHVLDAGALPDGTPWLAMERIHGESLRARLAREARLPVDDALEIGSAVLAALEAAHGTGVVHRDVKPENVLLDARSGQTIPKLADFGLARDQGPSITAPGSMVGTPRYIAPEIARGSNDFDARADIWSVGVLLYEMLAGKRPFDGHDVLSTVLAILSATPVPPREHRPELSPAIDTLVMRAMEKDPARRFGSASEMRMVVRAALAAEVSRTEEMDALGMALDTTALRHDDDGLEERDTITETLDRAATKPRDRR